MGPVPERRGASEPRDARELEDIGLYAVIAAGLVAGPPAFLFALAAQPFVGRRRPESLGAALAGLAVFALLWPTAISQLAATMDAAISERGLLFGGLELAAAWPHLWRWWLFALPLAPLLAVLIDTVRPKRVAERQGAEERRTERATVRRERRARRQVGVPTDEPAGPAAAMGRKVSGEAVLPTHRGWVSLPLERLARHLLVLGASGSGKTETVLRLVWAVARSSDWRIFFLDAKGDEQTMRRFHALMVDAGRDVRLFPREPYAGWRGNAREIVNRLIGLIDFATDGGGTYYRDTAQNLVRLAVEAPAGPPRSAEDFLARLRRERLEALWLGCPEAHDVAAYSARQVDECRQRYQSFFRAVGGRLDGAWAFEDADCGFLLLNELLYGEETAKLARLLVEDFKQFVASRKPDARRTLLIVDEFSALAEGTPIARVVETVRSYGAAVVLAPQVAEGMGGPEATARIVGSVGTVFLHQVPDPDAIAALAGTRLEVESSIQHEEGRATGMGSARTQHAYKVPPNEVRALSPGMCFVIGSGKAAKVQVARAPEVEATALPEPTAEPAPPAAVVSEPLRP